MGAYFRMVIFKMIAAFIVLFGVLLLTSHRVINQLVTILVLGHIPGTNFRVSFGECVTAAGIGLVLYSMYRFVKKFYPRFRHSAA